MTSQNETPDRGRAMADESPRTSWVHCPNGWTGGQYSAARFVLGIYLLVHFGCLVASAFEIPFGGDVLGNASENALYLYFPNLLFFLGSSTGSITLLLVAVGLSALFALGVRDRLVGLALLYLVTCFAEAGSPISNTGMPFIAWIFIAHTFVPRRPYGSWDARGRVDPNAGWRMTGWIHTATWIVLAISYAYRGFEKFGNPAWIDGSALLQTLSDPAVEQTLLGGFVLLFPALLLSLATWSVLALEICFAPLALVRKFRPLLWLVLLGVQVFSMALGGFADFSAGLLMLHLFAFDPAWVRSEADGSTATIFYDGGCGLCHRFIRFAIAEDREGTDFRFAPLEGVAFATLRESSKQSDALDDIDSIVLSLPDGSLLVRAEAVLEIGKRMGGLWRVAAAAASLFPMRVLDAGYDGIARIRRQIFTQPPDACPLLPDSLRERFDLD
jgi:predicted DCC family thiol-disulfide oxidoreductase YuxK